MANLSLDTPAEPQVTRTKDQWLESRTDVLLVASFGDAIANNFCEFVRGSGACDPSHVDLTLWSDDFDSPADVSSIVLFVKPKLVDLEFRTLADFLRRAARAGARSLVVVGTFRVHLHDRTAIETECRVRRAGADAGFCVSLVRSGNLVGTRSDHACRCWSPISPLIPRQIRSCFLDETELFETIEQERSRPRRKKRHVHTLLGANRPLREVLSGHRSEGTISSIVYAVSFVLSVFLIGQLVCLLVRVVAGRSNWWRRWTVQTVTPTTFRELRALYSPHNFRHVKMVGYNNGVQHFGHRYPGRTIVSTIHLNRVIPAGVGIIRADCGATIRKARDVLDPTGQDLPVVPNYSYVCLGTGYFVPIHGSASEFSCIAQTITRAVLYDPIADRLVLADQGTPEFGRFAYDTDSAVVLLRLYCRVKPRSAYFANQQTLDAPTASNLLDVLRDRQAANVEVRKANAAGKLVNVYRYYKQSADTPSPVLEIPRDSIGRIWDRLEENRLTSFLMHALTRHLAFHCELFFTAEKFKIFWDSHRGLPLKKIQLRYIRRDGLPNSPFRDQDCVSADMFMFPKHRGAFEQYLRRTFGGLDAVPCNPGKHSIQARQLHDRNH